MQTPTTSSGPVASSSSSVALEARLEAGPLPIKRGEIGYQEGVHVTLERNRSEDLYPALSARHPADHELQPSTISPLPRAQIAPERVYRTSSPPISQNSGSEVQSDPGPKRAKEILKFWKSRRLIRGGFQLNTAVLFLIQFGLTLMSIVGWVLSVYFLQKRNGIEGKASSIFIHVLFAVMVLAQLLFLERRLFRLRAERYMHIHPGEVLPTTRSRGRSRRLLPNSSIAFSPWNRPPLPTYAAAIAESGVGTGDVEDHLIAAPPPPAYGNTRGSTLLLRGYGSRDGRPVSAGYGSRPTSYSSREESTEDAEDAERARWLEGTLATLERSASRRESAV